MTNDELYGFVERKVNELREHFPDVQVLVSWVDDDSGNTIDIFCGKGNFYARVGMAREFLQRDESHVTAREIGKELKPSEDE